LVRGSASSGKKVFLGVPAFTERFPPGEAGGVERNIRSSDAPTLSRERRVESACVDPDEERAFPVSPHL